MMCNDIYIFQPAYRFSKWSSRQTEFIAKLPININNSYFNIPTHPVMLQSIIR